MKEAERLGDRTYVVITCARCGRERVLPSWKLVSMIRERGAEPKSWALREIAPRLVCSRCGTAKPLLTGR